MQRVNQYYLFLILLSLAAMVILFRIGSFPLTDRDEGEYAASGYQMMITGDYIVPHLNGRLYLEKPILFYWMLVGSFKMFGVNEFAARYPSALSALLVLTLIFFAIKRLTDNDMLAFWSGFVLLSSPLFLLLARACVTDMALTLFIIMALLGYFAWEEGRGGFWCWFGLWTGLALGFLTKGPVTLALCLPVFVIYSQLRRRWRWLRPLPLVAGLLWWLSLSLPWYYMIVDRVGYQFIDTFFLTQNLGRFSRTLLGHGGGPLYYILILIPGLYPNSFLLLEALKRSWRRRPWKNSNSASGVDALFLFALIGSGWGLFILTLAATKQPNYLLPVVPLASILCGYALISLSGQCPVYQGRLTRLPFVFISVLMVMLMAFVIVWHEFLWNSLLRGMVSHYDSSEYALPASMPDLTPWLVSLGLGLMVIVWAYTRLRNKGLALALGLFHTVILAVFFVPQLVLILQLPAKKLAQEVHVAATYFQREHKTEVKLLSYGLWKPSMIFYARMPIKRFKVHHFRRVKRMVEEAKVPVFIFTRVRLESYLLEKCPAIRPIKRMEGYLLAGNRLASKLFYEIFSMPIASTQIMQLASLPKTQGEGYERGTLLL